MLGPWFILQYFVSLIVLQSSCLGSESWLLYFCWLVCCFTCHRAGGSNMDKPQHSINDNGL